MKSELGAPKTLGRAAALSARSAADRRPITIVPAYMRSARSAASSSALASCLPYRADYWGCRRSSGTLCPLHATGAAVSTIVDGPLVPRHRFPPRLSSKSDSPDCLRRAKIPRNTAMYSAKLRRGNGGIRVCGSESGYYCRVRVLGTTEPINSALEAQHSRQMVAFVEVRYWPDR